MGVRERRVQTFKQAFSYEHQNRYLLARPCPHTLHPEFGSGWIMPSAVNGDVMMLAGDIITLKDYGPLDHFYRDGRIGVPARQRAQHRPVIKYNSVRLLSTILSGF